MSSVSETVCVTGATGFVGSWLVKMLIEQGYTVRATVRDPGNMKKVKHLVELRDAETKLSLWKADLTEEGSFDEAINGCSGVFHVATPVDFESKDPENEVIKPSINGVLDIMKSCLKAKTVRRVIYTSSASAAMVSKDKRLLLDETCWSDVDFCQTENMDGSMYFLLSKTLAEQEAWKFAKEHNIDLITILPTLVTGPFINPTVPHSVSIALSPITGDEALYPHLKDCSFVHVDDVCRAHIFLFEQPQAEGRYICSTCSANIHDLAKFLNQKYPHYNVPKKFKNIPEELGELVSFSSKKITDLGFQFKFTLEDMYTEAIDTCRKKGLIAAPEIKIN